ncbi:MAG: L-glyceraldehyde 3-phosphate reductase [Bacteroidetes bacterium ADurb.Bin217]|nr:MAG: L-glyceraldehyde 3-phosphate reductase [Bacteroidetes bacterium ADurb.Bin217]
MTYMPLDDRYSRMKYAYCGNSGLQLPKLSLGLWHNFGGVDAFENAKSMLLHAFDNGITHFDLANNYGPPAGSAEITFGQVLHKEFAHHRDELIISTKAGYWMWNGPYGDGGSKKYLVSSLDQSLQRLKLDYVDIYYHHRFDPHTPLEETASALELLYKQGKALYIGISNYSTEQTNAMLRLLQQKHVPCLIHQCKYSMFHREPETSGLLQILSENGVGSIAFSPLAQGLLTDRYSMGIPKDSRAAKSHGFLQSGDVNDAVLQKVAALQSIALQRNQSLAEMAIAWIWEKGVTSVLIGASSVNQLQTNLKALASPAFSSDEMNRIEQVLHS